MTLGVRTRPAGLLWILVLAAMLLLLPPSHLLAGGRDWLDAPQARPELDTLLAPPGRPLGGRDVEQDPALSPNGRWLAYAALVDGNWDIWLRDLQAGPGQAPRRLTTHVAADLRPSFSADGRSLLFISQREDVAGDMWELPIQRRPGALAFGQDRALLRREGAQDHPSRDAEGTLLWEEESAAGPRVMRRAAKSRPLELACPASLPRAGHGGVYFVRPREGREELVFVADSLMSTAAVAARVVWQPPSGLLDYQPGPEGRLWACTLEDGPAQPGRELALPSQVWQVPRDGSRPPRPLLERGRAARQLSLARGRMVLTADGRPSTLWLEDAEGRFPVGTQAATGKGASSASAGTWLELARRYEGDELGLPLLQSIQAAWPGSKASDDAALRETRLRMLAGEDSTVLLDRVDQLRGWLSAPDARQRLAALELEIRLREGGTGLEALTRLISSTRQANLSGATSEAALALARLELGKGRPQRALTALLEFESLPDTLPEQADALMLRVRAWEAMGEASAARGALAQLATRHPHRPELLAEWLRRDLEALAGLPATRARLRLRERLEDLKGIPALHMALMVELARREAEAGQDGRTVAQEDLRLVLELDPAALPPFQRRVWTRGQALLADLRRQDGELDKGLEGLARADAQLEKAAEPGLQGLLRVRRLDWLLHRARLAEQDGDWEAVEADTRQMLRLDPVETRAWRLRLEALARLDRTREAERELRHRRSQWSRRGGALRGAALQQRAVETWALALLLSWRADEHAFRLAESDRLLEEALSLDDRLAVACLTSSWNLSRELAALEARRGGFGGLLQELRRLPETLARLRHQGFASLREPDEEAMRDRAILLAGRGMAHALSQGDSLLAAALATNLGNLHFSRGEFGAQAARRAWEERVALNPHFASSHERLRFLMQLGTVRQWSGDLERAALDLDSAQALATRLGAQEEGRQVVARLAMLAVERDRPVEAMAWLRQALALEADAGQRALLWRNLAMVQVEMGDPEAALSLATAEREAQAGPWPLEPAQNWLRLRLLGVGLPLWNFPGLYTGQGRLDWGPEEEQALRQALKDELSGREGALDQRMDGLHARRRLLRRQGDKEGMLRLDLVIARELALLGRWEQALLRCRQAAADAREAFLPGPEARAVESAMAIVLLAERDGNALSREAADQARVAVNGMLGASAELLPLEQRLRLELLRVQDLDDRAGLAQPVQALLLRSEALLALEDLESWIKDTALVLNWRQRLGLDLAWARLLSATGDPEAAHERVAAWRQADLPPASALLRDWAAFQVAWTLGDAASRGRDGAKVEQDLAALRAESAHLPYSLLVAPVAEGLRAAQAMDAGEALADELAWRKARFLWEQADPPFASQGAANAQARLRADAREAARIRESLLANPEGGLSTAAADSLLEEDETLLGRMEDRLVLWKPQGEFPSLWPQWKGQGVAWAPGDSLSRWISASPRLHAACREGRMRAPDGVALVGAEGPATDPRVSRVAAESLMAEDFAPLESRVLALDGVLHLVPGSEQASWIQCGPVRIPLRRLMGLDLPGELLVIGQVDWLGRSPAQWQEAWLVLESLLAQSGLRRALLPAPGVALRGAALEAFAMEQGLREITAVPEAPPEGWFALGAPPLTSQEAEVHRRQALEEMARRGAEHRKAQRPEAAWREWRRALRLSVQMRDHGASATLMRQSAGLALDLQRPGDALDLLLDALSRMDSTRVEWDKVAGRLVQVADIASRPALADSLWSRWILAPLARVDSIRGAQLERQALETRLAVLASRGMAHRAAALAAARELRPEDGDPRRALFLARLFLETEFALRARACLDQAGVRWEELPPQDKLEELELRALVLQRLGDLGGARLRMDEAARLVEASPPDSMRLALHARHQADLAWQLGDFSRCSMELDRAQALLPSQAGELSRRLGLQLANTRGLLAMDLEERESAAAHFALAFTLGKSLDDPAELSAVCNNQSLLAQQGGDWVQALDLARQAAGWDSLAPGGGRAWTTLRNQAASLRGLLAVDLRLPEAWASLPEALLRQGHARSQLETLLDPLGKGRDTAREAGESRESCRLGLELARFYMDLEEWEDALERALDLSTDARGHGFTRESLEADLVAARSLKALRRPGEARALLEEALVRAEDESARLAPMRFDPGRGRMQRLLTDELVELLVDVDPWQALVSSERGRTLGLREMVARSTLGRDMPTLDSVAEVEALLEKGLEPGQEWLGWHVGQHKSWAFWWHEGKLDAWTLGVSRDSLRLAATLHRNRVLAFLSAEETGARLARWLLPEAWLRQPPRRAWIMPQAELYDIALETLRLPDGRWLGECTALCRGGSLAELAYSGTLPGGGGAGAVWSDPLGTGMEALDFTSLESDELLRVHPDSRLFQGALATEASVASDQVARRFRHFACHAVHDPRSPAQSALLLGAGGGRDGRLSAPEIAGLELPAGLTMLSACETALGRGGEEAGAGLPRAFLAAGSRGVVASLWKVDDLATAVLVKHLHRALAAGDPADLALQKAQQAVRVWVNGHPAYWAAFCLTGQARPESEGTASR